jgi:UPF0271 protein
MHTIDLNADLGEHPGDSVALAGIITSANVAGGGHAGGGDLLTETIDICVQNNIQIGAHPAYPDRENFGRTSLWGTIDQTSLHATIVEQIRAVAHAAAAHGRTLSHVKAHGALYNDAMVNVDVARLFLSAVASATAPGTPVFGLPNSVLEDLAYDMNIPFIREGFMDRAYQQDGTLVPRTQPGAVLTDPTEATTHVLNLAVNHQVIASNGKTIHIDVDTICVHADTEGAAALLTAVSTALGHEGITIAPFTPTPVAVPFGDHAHLVLHVPTPAALIDVLAADFPEATVRAGLDTLLITWADTADLPDLTTTTMTVSTAVANHDTHQSTGTHHTIPVVYYGEDLHSVGADLSLTASEVAALHTSITYRVALIGFAPGFPYLVPVDPESDAARLLATVGRRSTPRTAVPAGSVALASGMSSIYPSEMPGGWNLLGTTTATLFDPTSSTPSVLTAGDTVTFTDVTFSTVTEN